MKKFTLDTMHEALIKELGVLEGLSYEKATTEMIMACRGTPFTVMGAGHDEHRRIEKGITEQIKKIGELFYDFHKGRGE